MATPESITVDPNVRFGKPCVRGTRITVEDVIGYLAGAREDWHAFGWLLRMLFYFHDDRTQAWA